MLNPTELTAFLGGLNSSPKATSTDVVFFLAFCFSSLWLIMRVSVSSMRPQKAPTPQVAWRGFVGPGLLQTDRQGSEQRGVGAGLCPCPLSWHPRPSVHPGVQLGCSLLQGYCLCKVGAGQYYSGTPPKDTLA